jgi:hypothetical protein
MAGGGKEAAGERNERSDERGKWVVTRREGMVGGTEVFSTVGDAGPPLEPRVFVLSGVTEASTV